MKAEAEAEPGRVRIEELRLAGFRAFANARLALDDLTVLVGRNGSGKSTVIDALEFIRDALGDSLENAIDRRGGIQALMHKPSGSKGRLSLAVKLRLPIEHLDAIADEAGLLPLRRAKQCPYVEARYGFQLGLRRGGAGFAVEREGLRFTDSDGLPGQEFDSDFGDFHRVRGDEESSLWAGDALALPLVAAKSHPFRGVLEALRGGIRAYDFSPALMRAEPPVGRANALLRGGGNLGDVLRQVEKHEDDLAWVVKHLGAITPGLVGVKAGLAAGRRLVRFFQRAGGSAVRFDIGDMSDGTLRCLAILLALRQKPTPAIVCIDEIEDSVHPAALGVLLDAVAASTGRCQVLLTSHSPEALSHPAVTAERVRVVEWRDGRSDVFRLSPGAEAMSRPPRSVGKLLRANALFTSERPERVEGDFFEVA